MTHVLLLHSALGLRPSVIGFADRLRAHGLDVTTPDYYDGRVFASEREGIAYRDEVGPGTLYRELLPLVENLPKKTVLAGFSLGAAFAQRLAAERPKSKAVILMHSVAAPRGPWPGQPVQVHRYEEDRWIAPADVDALRAAVEASDATFEDFVTPGRGHLFTDLDGPDGDVGATALAVRRIAARLTA